jgi:hypothetical protein
MTYRQDDLLNISSYKPPKKKKVFGVKKKNRKDKEKPGRKAGVATAVAAGLYFGLNPLAKALGFGSPGRMNGSPVKMEECSVDASSGIFGNKNKCTNSNLNKQRRKTEKQKKKAAKKRVRKGG